MPDKDETPIKIKRSRKRLYDPLTQENDKLKQEEPEPTVVQAECVQAESSDTEIIVADNTAEPVPKAVGYLPESYRKMVDKSTLLAIGQAWDYTMLSLSPPEDASDNIMSYRTMSTISGAIGGVGIWSLVVELPITTIIMLRAVADIAKDEGENYQEPETRLACLEVFALGGEVVDKETGETGYYAIRSSLNRPLEESSKYIAKKGIAGMGAPFAAQMIAKIAAHYQTVVAARIAASVIPVAGAAVGAAVNIWFMNLFQDKARGHFIVRRLEREYGHDEVKRYYKEI